MKKSRFSEEQIIGVLKEDDAGMKVADRCRKHGTAYRMRRSITGVAATAAWMCRKHDDCGSWKRKTSDSSSCWQIRRSTSRF